VKKLLDLAINFDGTPAQTSWEIIDVNNNVVASGGNYGSNSSNSSLTEAACLPDGCYDLVFYDSVNNGMCPFRAVASSSGTFITPGTLINSGSIVATLGTVVTPGICGNYTLTDTDGNVLASGGGGFGASETNSFCITNGVQNFQSGSSATYMRQSVTNDNTPDMALLPNLVRDQFTVRYTLDTENNVQINILNVNGQIIQQHTSNNQDAQDMLLNVSDLAQGFYFVQLISGETQLVRKFVKQ